MQETSSVSSWNVTSTSSLLRAHAPDLLPSLQLRHRLARRVFAGRCQPLLGTGPSRRYLCQSFPACLDPYSGCSQGARARFFPQDIGLPRRSIGSARRFPRQLLQSRATYRSCSHSLMFRPTDSLATPVAPTAHLAALGSRGFYIRAYQSSLPHPAADMLSAQIRAIDGRRTSPPKIGSLDGCSASRVARAFLVYMLSPPRHSHGRHCFAHSHP